MRYETLLFDLDGTITDSFEGIINSVIYSLKKLNAEVPPMEILKKYVGPPLMDSYMEHNGFDRKKAETALYIYREYFGSKGIFENRLYDGMGKLLEDLSEKYQLLLATSKPEEYAKTIAKHFNFEKDFDNIFGILMDDEKLTKTDVMKKAINHAKSKDKSKIIMIGDTKYDILGAKNCGVDSIGVLYGAGTMEDLKDATYIAKDIDDLRKILL